jgi:putative tryptophan/tyrosine transport system substrate-binding protein
MHHVTRRQFTALLGGAAAAWPVAARARQPERMPVIGLLDFGSPRLMERMLAAFRQGLAKAGYVEGQNVAIEFRWAGSQSTRLPALAAELVHRQVAVIFTGGWGGPALAAKAATSTIPIVFAYGGDPVKDGLVAGLNHPGGNITGVTASNTQLVSKWLSFVGDLVPQATTIAFLSGDSSSGAYEDQKSQMLAAARALGRQVTILEARSNRDYEMAFKTLVQREAGALVVGPFAFRNTNEILGLAARYKIPALYPRRDYVDRGGLMSYAADYADAFRQAGIYTGRILKGEKPADLPVVQATKFELVINLITAKALGIAIPSTVLALADEVIE